MGETADSEEVPGCSPSYRDPERQEFGCEHYKRNCKVLSACCNKLFTCRFCHDKVSDHSMDRWFSSFHGVHFYLHFISLILFSSFYFLFLFLFYTGKQQQKWCACDVWRFSLLDQLARPPPVKDYQWQNTIVIFANFLMMKGMRGLTWNSFLFEVHLMYLKSNRLFFSSTLFSSFPWDLGNLI